MIFQNHPPAKCCVECFVKEKWRALVKSDALSIVFSGFCFVAVVTSPRIALTQAKTSAPDVLTSLDTSQLHALRYRMIGPARGGRVTTVTGVPQEPMTFYMGTVGGGVWKTTNAGITWSNISDGYFAAGSMGSIDVADSDPNIIYAGTGSEALRSNVSIGRGIYKSIDAG